MAAGDINDPLTNIPNVVLVDQSAATAAPGAGYARLEVVDGVLGVRAGAGEWTPLGNTYDGPTLHALAQKVTPVDADELLIADSADSWAAKRALRSAIKEATGDGGLFDAYLCYADEKAQNTSGEQIDSGAWRTRTLNTERADTASIGALASNRITLPAATYVAKATAPGFYCNHFQARIYDVTGAAVLLLGSTEYNTAGIGNNQVTRSHVAGLFTLSAQSEVELQQQVETTYVAAGGTAANFGTEVYSILELWRLA